MSDTPPIHKEHPLYPPPEKSVLANLAGKASSIGNPSSKDLTVIGAELKLRKKMERAFCGTLSGDVFIGARLQTQCNTVNGKYTCLSTLKSWSEVKCLDGRYYAWRQPPEKAVVANLVGRASSSGDPSFKDVVAFGAESELQKQIEKTFCGTESGEIFIDADFRTQFSNNACVASIESWSTVMCRDGRVYMNMDDHSDVK